MPKEVKKIERLSNFFQTNLHVLRQKNEVVEFVSPYFSDPAKEESNLQEIKKKKVKQKLAEPCFQGFPQNERDNSRVRRAQMERAVIRCEDRIKDAMLFLGFSDEEVASSKLLRDKIRSHAQQYENFRGFFKEDRLKSIAKVANLLAACDTIRANIYDKIDRRVLKNHMKENKIVCSKYWYQDAKITVKTEEEAWKDRTSVCDSTFLKKSRNGIKHENLKTDIATLDRENAILLQIQKLNRELIELRKLKYATTPEMPLQNSPFIQIKKELVMSQFVPPKSPHNLLEEELYHDPWALLVATIFLNKTSGRSARPYVFWFLEENPDPLSVLAKSVDQLETYFGALGLQKTRAMQVWRMSHDFLYKEWKNAGELFGIGRYAEDAFKMFCLGDFSFEPRDRYLRIYKAWYEMQEKAGRIKEMND